MIDMNSTPDTDQTSDNVVSMARFRPNAAQPAIAQIEGYWHGLRTDGDLPRRSDIDPRGIEGALEHAFVLERIAPGIARFRIAGQHINALMGMEVRGMPISSLFTAEARPRLIQLLEKVFSAPQIVEIPLKAGTTRGRQKIDARILMLPLLGEDGQVSRVLGAIVADGLDGTLPRRLEIGDGPIRQDRIIFRASRPEPMAAFAEPPAPFVPQMPLPDPKRRATDDRPVLRLVASDERR